MIAPVTLEHWHENKFFPSSSRFDVTCRDCSVPPRKRMTTVNSLTRQEMNRCCQWHHLHVVVGFWRNKGSRAVEVVDGFGYLREAPTSQHVTDAESGGPARCPCLLACRRFRVLYLLSFPRAHMLLLHTAPANRRPCARPPHHRGRADES